MNIREPACVVALSADDLTKVARIDGLPAGPHGLDLDRQRNRAFVASDAGSVGVLDLTAFVLVHDFWPLMVVAFVSTLKGIYDLLLLALFARVPPEESD